MRGALTRVADGASAIGFALFGVLLLGVGVVSVVNGNLLGLLLAGIGTASAAAAIETWTGMRFRWRPASVVAASLAAYLVLTVIGLQNIGP